MRGLALIMALRRRVMTHGRLPAAASPARHGTCRPASARATPCWRARPASGNRCRGPGDRDDRSQHGDAEAAPDPFAGAERRFIAAKTRPPTSSARPARSPRPPHRQAAAGGLDAGALQRRAGQDQAEHRARRRAPRAGRSRRRAAARRRPSTRSLRVPVGAIAESRAPSATSGRVRRSASAGNSSVTPNRASSAMAANAAVLVGLDRPAAADGRQGRDRREGQPPCRRASAGRCAGRAGPPVRTRKAAPAGCRG